MERIVLKIYGFKIKINFYPAESNFLKNKLKEEIRSFYKAFIAEMGGKADFTINLIERKNIEIVYKKNQTKYKIFINLYEKKSSHTVLVYYQSSLFHFQYILKDILSELLYKNKGFTLHSSGINFKGKAILFMGKSGSGKSTAMTFLNKKYPAIADDSLAVKKEGEKYLIYETPFIETNSWVRKENRSFETSRLFFLKKAKDFKIVKIKDKEYVFNRIIKQVWTEKQYLKKQMKYILEFVDKMSFYFLYFAKDRQQLIKLFETLELNEKL